MIRRRRHIVHGGEVVGWITPVVDGPPWAPGAKRFHAYIALGDGRYARGVGDNWRAAVDAAWSAHRVLQSEVQETTEETT